MGLGLFLILLAQAKPLGSYGFSSLTYLKGQIKIVVHEISFSIVDRVVSVFYWDKLQANFQPFNLSEQTIELLVKKADPLLIWAVIESVFS